MVNSFGVPTWSKTELSEMDRAVHRPHFSTIRLYLKRHQGGKGLLNLEATHGQHICFLKNNFRESDSPFVQAICRAEEKYSALGLSAQGDRVSGRSSEEWIEEWKSRAFHDRYASLLESGHVDKVESLLYLRAGYLFPQTVGRLIAIKDQVMPTRIYLNHIAKQDIPSDK